MKKITLLILFLSTLWGYSQVKNYTFTQSNGAYDELTTGTALGNETSNDQYFIDPAVPLGNTSSLTGPGLPIGFNFIFNGFSYDRFAVHANGWIALGTSTLSPSMNMSGASNAAPISSAFGWSPEVLSARIAPFAKDLKAQAGGGIKFKIVGEAPNRVLVVQWKKYMKNYSGTGDSFDFQIRLSETTNTVSFVYGTIASTSSTASTFQVGLRALPTATATNFVNRTTASDWANTSAGTTAAATVSVNNTIKPGLGLTYTWSPAACSEPKDLVITAVTANSATLNWGALIPVPSSGYEYAYSTSATLPSGSGTAVADPTAVLTGLTAGTTYNVFLRSVCGTEMSQWKNFGTFKTKCADVTTLTENFDSYTSGSSTMPDCWLKAGNGTCYVGDAGGNKFYMSANGSATTPTAAYAIIPNIGNLQSGTHRLKFKAYATVGSRTFNVGYLTDINDVSTFTQLSEPINLTTGAQQFIIVPAGIPEGIKNIVFKNAGTGTTLGATTLYIDDVVWEPNASCAEIKNIVAKLPTSTSVQVTWTGGTETAWQYVVAPSAVTNPSSLVATDADSKAVTVAGLTPSTSYKIWVRSKCGESDFGLWSASASFLTPCTSVETIVEDFDANTTLPECWRKLGSNGTISVSAAKGTAFSNALELRAHATNEAVFLAIPPLSTSGTNGYRLKFKCKTLNENSKMDIICYKDPINLGGTSSFTILKSVAITTANTEYSINEILVPAETAYLGIRFYNTFAGGTLYIDDFVWEPISACPDVMAVAINSVTAESVDLGWKTNSAEGDWQYVLTNTKVSNPNTLTAKSFVDPFLNGSNVASAFSNLTPSTNYKYWIRSRCSAESIGSWVGPFYFTTSCVAIDGFVQKFDASTDLPSCWAKAGLSGTAIVTTMAGTSAPNVLKLEANTNSKAVVTMPPANFTGDGTNVLRFKLSGSEVGAKVEVGYMINPQDPTKFIALKTYTVGSTTVYSDEFAELGFEPASQVLAFRNPGTTTTNSSVYIDDVVWEPLPTCSDISAVVYTGITSSTIGLSWKKGGTEASWQYVIGDSSVSDPKTLAAVTFVLPTVKDSDVSSMISGLNPSTSYRVWLRSKCGGATAGTWIGPIVFTTTCAPTDKFTQKFDGETNIPACWNKVGTQGTIAVTAIGGASAPNALTMTSTATAKAVVNMQPVSNAGAGTHRLRFKFRNSVANANIHIGYLTDKTDPLSFVLVEAIAAEAKDVFYSRIVNLGNNPTSEILAFRNPDASTIYIDDVYWEPIPTCSDLSASPVKASSNEAELAWKVDGSETMWQYTVGSSTDLDPNMLTAVDFVAPVVTDLNAIGKVKDLMPATSYRVWIRSKCSDSSFGVWSEPVSFATHCAPGVSITENFDTNTNMPSCWSKVGSQGTASINPVIGAPSGSNALYMQCASSATKPVVAITPVSTLTASIFRFKFKCDRVGGVIELGYLKIVNDPSSFVSLKTFTSTTISAYESAMAVLDFPPASQVFAFRNAGSPTTSTAFFIDDVTWEPISNGVLGIDAFETNNFAFYPNPVRDILTMTLNEEITNVAVFNLLGQQVINQSLKGNQVKIDMSDLSRGAYFVKVISGNQSKTVKVIKE